MMFAKNQRSNGPKTKKLWKFKVSNFSQNLTFRPIFHRTDTFKCLDPNFFSIIHLRMVSLVYVSSLVDFGCEFDMKN